MAGTRADAQQQGIVGRLRARYDENTTLFWVCALIFVNQLGFGSIVPVVPIYAESFGVSQTAIGLTIAIYGLARFLVNVPAGQICDRYGRRIALALGGLVTIIGNLICAASPDYWVFLSGRFVAGAGAAMVLTGTQVILADISTPANRGRMMATYMGVFLFAVGIGPLPGGILAEYVSLSAPFYAFALLGIGTTSLAWFRIPETRPQQEADGKAGAGHAPPKMGFIQQLRLLTSKRGFLLISIVSFCTFFARTGALFNLIPTFAHDQLGLTTAAIGTGLAMISIVGMIVAYPSGVLVDRFGRKAVIVPSTIFSGVAMILFALATGYGLFMVACIAWAFSSGIAAAAPAAYAADMAPEGMNAPAMSTYRMLADFGYVAGPLLLGTTADLVSTEVALYFTAGLVLVAGVVFAILAPESLQRGKIAASPTPSAVRKGDAG